MGFLPGVIVSIFIELTGGVCVEGGGGDDPSFKILSIKTDSTSENVS